MYEAKLLLITPYTTKCQPAQLTKKVTPPHSRMHLSKGPGMESQRRKHVVSITSVSYLILVQRSQQASYLSVDTVV